MLRNLSCCFGEHLEGDDSAVTLKRSPLPRTSETIQRPSSGCQYFPIPTARPKASQLSHASYPLCQGCSCSCCSWKCCLQHDNPPSPHAWMDRPKWTYPQEEAQSLGATQAVAERHEEGAVCGKDSHPARAAACDCLACPGPNRLAGQHSDRRKRQHPTEQWDITSSAGCRNRWHLTKDGMLWRQRQLLGQEDDKALLLPGVEGEGTVPYPGLPTNEGTQPLTERLIPANPCGHGEIRPIDDGLAEKHQLSRH